MADDRDFAAAVKYLRTLHDSHYNSYHLTNEQRDELQKALQIVEEAHAAEVQAAVASQQMKPAKGV